LRFTSFILVIIYSNILLGATVQYDAML